MPDHAESLATLPASHSVAQLRSDSYGLHKGVLSPLETLAQSVSTMAPSTSPALTIPLVFALAGNATWLVYLVTLLAMLPVGFCVSQFARFSSSPGSLYSYTAETLSPWPGALAGWALLLAYLATGASVAGGALYYANIFLLHYADILPPAPLVLGIVFLLAGFIAMRDVKLSAQLMLWIEIISVGLIVLVLLIAFIRSGFAIDGDQLSLRGVRFNSLGPAIVLSMFSFVGFESATTLGGEAHEPLKTIPRAVLQCVLLAGLFFVLCAYGEVAGFRLVHARLTDATSPLHLIANQAGVSLLGTAIDLGAFVSMFACVLACLTASSRVLLKMSHTGLLPSALSRTHRRFGTPAIGIAVSGATMFAMTLAVSLSGTTASDIYGWFGSISVFGFLTAYALVAVALPFAHRLAGRRSRGIVIASAVTVVIAIAALLGSVFPVPLAPALWFPYLYLAYLAVGMGWFQLRRRWVRESSAS